MARILLEALGVEFEEGGNTIWIHGREGTILRIKCSGRVTAKTCTASIAHADVMVDGDISFGVPDLDPDPKEQVH